MDALISIIWILNLIVLGRVTLVYKINLSALRKTEELPLTRRLDWLDNIHPDRVGSWRRILDLTRWTFNQFYPEFKDYGGQQSKEREEGT